MMPANAENQATLVAMKRSAPKALPSLDEHARAKFWTNVDTSGECWVWTGSKSHSGYGLFYVAGGMYLAHRLAWEMTNDAKLGTLLACHHCDNPPCVRPDHLFAGTNSDNMRDMFAKGRHAPLVCPPEKLQFRPFCRKAGHARTPDNVDGGHRCKACERERRERRTIAEREAKANGSAPEIRLAPGTGERGPHSKLTEAQVRAIIEDRTLTERQWASRLGVSRSTIHYIRAGEMWSDVGAAGKEPGT
jgi:hypothetical protein